MDVTGTARALTRPRRSDQVLMQSVGGSVVLLNLSDGQYYALDRVGGRIWELCDGIRPTPEVVSIIQREYDATAETIEADVLELLGDLADEKLVFEGA